MVDDAYYISPHETALAVVATAMKKARLQIDVLIINSLLGGVFFSCGGLLLLAGHADNPKLFEENPGIPNMFSGITFGIALYYVIITGVDLFNSNILYFSVGFFRRAVTIYDLLISWIVSLLGNIAASLFVSYLFGYLSGIGRQSLWRTASRKIAEDKISYSFIETFLKGIAGNFLVSLAVYLQLMAKPIHVKFIVLLLPIFTFITIGFTHAVGDMAVVFVGMYNGANVPVGKYIWKLLIPGVVGNIIGGSAFGLVIPFYLHLIVVERDQRKIGLPEYDLRDEQPDLNVDSRVVRVKKTDENLIDDVLKDGNDEKASDDTHPQENTIADDEETIPSVDSQATSTSHATNYSSLSVPSESSLHSFVRSDNNTAMPRVKNSEFSRVPLSRRATKNPAGVFPVYGMGEPLSQEKTIQSGFRRSSQDSSITSTPERGEAGRTLTRYFTTLSARPRTPQRVYDANTDKPGALLGRAITSIIAADRVKEPVLPTSNHDITNLQTTQTSHAIEENSNSNNKRENIPLSLFKTITKKFNGNNSK